MFSGRNYVNDKEYLFLLIFVFLISHVTYTIIWGGYSVEKTLAIVLNILFYHIWVFKKFLPTSGFLKRHITTPFPNYVSIFPCVHAGEGKQPPTIKADFWSLSNGALRVEKAFHENLSPYTNVYGYSKRSMSFCAINSLFCRKTLLKEMSKLVEKSSCR